LFSPADGKRLVKRIIGLPGDRVALRNNRLIINGKAADYRIAREESNSTGDGQELRIVESFGGKDHVITVTPSRPAIRSFGPVTVPPDSYLVLGDNRDSSADSRFFGFVPRSEIVGRASAVVISVDLHNYFLPRFSRFLTTLS
jgi:signal peptidase I